MCVSLPNSSTAHSAPSSSENESDQKASAASKSVIRVFNSCPPPLSICFSSSRLSPVEDMQRALNQKIGLLIANAIAQGEEAAMKLLGAFTNLGIENNLLLRESCRQGWGTLVKALLKRWEIDPTVGDEQYLDGAMPVGSNAPLIAASLNGRTEIVKMLLKVENVDPSAEDNLALVLATNGKIAKLLLKHPKMEDPNHSRSKPAIFLASYWGRKDVVKALLKDPRVDPSVCQNAAIFFAHRRGWSDLVQHLLSDDRVNPEKLGTYKEWYHLNKSRVYPLGSN